MTDRVVTGTSTEAVRNRVDLLRLRKTCDNETYVRKALERGFSPDVISLYFGFTIGTIND